MENQKQPVAPADGGSGDVFAPLGACSGLEAIMEHSWDGVHIADGQGVTLWVNRAYEAITGQSGKDMLGCSMWDLEREGVVERSGTLLVLAQRKAVTFEHTFSTGSHALIAASPVFDEGGRIVMVVTNVRDITELRQLQEKYRQTAAAAQRYQAEIEFARKQVLSSADLIAADGKMLEVLTLVDRAAGLDTTVLLLGEAGVGKEKIAKYIYKNSPRRGGRFLVVNCGAIPPSQMELELFGCEKSIQDGVSHEGKMGLFEVAERGTVFLHEVAELPLDMQVKLLRVLQEGTIVRVGGSAEIHVDVRVLAATDRNLPQMVQEKTFREDLYYQLNVVPIQIPPLRQRRGDILPLVESMLGQLNKKYGFDRAFAPSALRVMEGYSWPGNVRELKSVVERMVILSGEAVIEADHLPFREAWAPTLYQIETGHPVNLKALTTQFELQFMRRAYEKYGNVREAAASLGMEPSTFVRKRQRYGDRNELV